MNMPTVQFQSGWHTQDVVHRRVIAPALERVYWRARNASGEEVWLAEYPRLGDSLECFARLSRMPRHVGLPLVRILETDADGLVRLGVAVPAGIAPLGDRLRNGTTMPPAERLACFHQVAHALDALHACGIAHRNLSPEAVLWNGEHAVLLDAGWPDEVDLGLPEAATARLAPERREGAEADGRSDQFLLARLWLALCGHEVPDHTLLWDLIDLRPEPERRVLEDASMSDPEHRFPDCAAFAERLRHVLGVGPSVPAESTASGKAWLARLFPPAAPSPRTLSLPEYRALVRPLGRPTEAQIDAYIDYLVGKHSWYKHLPAVLPGAIFTLFIDPVAGMIREQIDGGPPQWRDIAEDETLRHYSMMPTSEYRRRFACLGYRTIEAPPLSLPADERASAALAEPRHFDTVESEFGLPKELISAGSAEVTAVIHELGKAVFVWDRVVGDPGLRNSLPHGSWPERSGGQGTLDRIADCLQQRDEAGIAALIAPERRHQLAALRAAARRVVALCFD
jgi:hypothetical protein